MEIDATPSRKEIPSERRFIAISFIKSITQIYKK